MSFEPDKDPQAHIKRLEQELEELRPLKAQFERMSTSSPVIFYNCDPKRDFATTFVSANVQDILGYSPQEILSDSQFWNNRLHPEDASVVHELFKTMDDSGPILFEYRFQHKDGHWVWLQDIKSIVFDNNGQPVELIGHRADITQAKQERDALLEHQGLFSTVFNHAASGIAICDAKGNFTQANEKWLELFGLRWDEIQGRTPLDFTAPEDVEESAARINSLLRGEADAFRFEKRFVHKDGTPFWVDMVSRCIRDDQGLMQAYVGVINDVTKRREAEDALRQSEERLRFLVENLPVLIHAHDEDGNYAFWNQECERVLGHKAQTIIGNPNAPEILFPDPAYRKLMDDAHIRSNEHRSMEANMQAADGQTRTILWSQLSPDQPIPGGLHWEAGVDITERKIAENALRASETEKKIILDTISESVLYQTTDRRIIWGNKAACKLSQMKAEELRGKNCFEVWHGQTEACRADICPVRLALKEGRPMEAEVSGHDDRTWLVKGYPIFDDNGDITGAIEVARDITSRKKALEDMRKAREMAEDATKMKDEFLANMSHELRSPLNGVLGMLDVLLDTDLDDNQKDCITTALQAGEGLLAIINDILDFSKLQAQKIALARSEFDLRDTLRTVCSTFREQSRRKGLDVTYAVPEDFPKAIIGDEGRIRQILFNLVGNSIKFTKAGQVAADVRIMHREADPQAARLLFTVTDTGIGIPEDEIETVFDPFVQLNWAKSRKYEGTGLGLGIVKRLVTLMGGIISVESTVGQGTRVSFWVNITLPED